MAEYIEREATIELLRSLGSRDYRREKGTIQEAIKMVSFSEYTPAADVARVTRRKDCKHFKHYGKTSLLIDGEHIKAGWCYRRARYDEEYRMPPDGFCSYGERKDG